MSNNRTRSAQLEQLSNSFKVLTDAWKEHEQELEKKENEVSVFDHPCNRLSDSENQTGMKVTYNGGSEFGLLFKETTKPRLEFIGEQLYGHLSELVSIPSKETYIHIPLSRYQIRKILTAIIASLTTGDRLTDDNVYVSFSFKLNDKTVDSDDRIRLEVYASDHGCPALLAERIKTVLADPEGGLAGGGGKITTVTNIDVTMCPNEDPVHPLYCYTDQTVDDYISDAIAYLEMLIRLIDTTH